MRVLRRAVSGPLLVIVFLCAAISPSGAVATTGTDEWPRWRWPSAAAPAVVNPFRAPAHEYGAGHRGVDIGTSINAAVTAPADGVVAFRGIVVDRPLLTIEHADGLVTTFEPLRSELLPGEPVTAGQVIGQVDVGGHTPPGALHLGVRSHGDYINPMLLFGGAQRAILLPCCASW